MKAIVSNELKKRLEFASKNGSVVAADVLNELKKDKKECFGDKKVDYFDSMRIVGNNSEHKSLKIVVTACMKDLNDERFPDKGNPRAPYFKENRERIELGTFVGLFRNLRVYESEELNFFYSAMCVTDIVKYRVCKSMNDFERAYLSSNYYPYGSSSSPLHNSCMRYESTARNVADFYVNFAGARILIAEDSQGLILGRAVVWDNAYIEDLSEEVRMVDRMYFCYEFVRQGMLKYAENTLKVGILKAYNKVGSEKEFICYLKDFEGLKYYNVHIDVPQVKWHKKGAPYMDTLCYLCLNNGRLVLRNYQAQCVAKLLSTSGYGTLCNSRCPICGRTTYGEVFCDECKREIFEETPFGTILKGKTRKYKGSKFPESLFKDGKPTEGFMNWIGIKRITDEYFKL